MILVSALGVFLKTTAMILVSAPGVFLKTIEMSLISAPVVFFKDNRDNRDNSLIVFFLRFSFTSKLKIVSIVSIVFKTSASGPNKKSFVLKNLVSEEKYCLYSQSKEKMKKADFTASLNLLYNNIMNIFYFFLYGYKFQLSFMGIAILFL